jgi:hypothetical protein
VIKKEVSKKVTKRDFSPKNLFKTYMKSRNYTQTNESKRRLEGDVLPQLLKGRSLID